MWVFVAARGVLIAVASLVAGQALGTWASVVAAHGLNSCALRALQCKLCSCGTQA